MGMTKDQLEQALADTKGELAESNRLLGEAHGAVQVLREQLEHMRDDSRNKDHHHQMTVASLVEGLKSRDPVYPTPGEEEPDEPEGEPAQTHVDGVMKRIQDRSFVDIPFEEAERRHKEFLKRTEVTADA